MESVNTIHWWRENSTEHTDWVSSCSYCDRLHGSKRHQGGTNLFQCTDNTTGVCYSSHWGVKGEEKKGDFKHIKLCSDKFLQAFSRWKVENIVMHLWDFIWLSSALSFCHKADSTTLCCGGIPPVKAAKGKGARTPVGFFKFIFVCTITQCMMKKRVFLIWDPYSGNFFIQMPESKSSERT